MRGDQFPVQQADIGQQLRRGHAVALLHIGDFTLGVRQMKVDAVAVDSGQITHPAQKARRTGVRSVHAELAGNAPIGSAIPFGNEIKRLLNRFFSDGIAVDHPLFGQKVEIEVEWKRPVMTARFPISSAARASVAGWR